MSGKPVISGVLVVAAGVINPPRSQAIPKPYFALWLRMGALRNLAESDGWQKPGGQSKFRSFIIKVGPESHFWQAALQFLPYFYWVSRPQPAQAGRWALSPADTGYVETTNRLLKPA